MPWRPSGESEEPQPIGASVDRYVRRFGPGASALTVIFSRWEEIVGVAVATHARPLSLSSGTLIVGVDAPAWATQLRFLSADLIQRLADVAGPDAVSGIDVRVRP